MKSRWASSGRFERVLSGHYPFGVSRRQRTAAPVAAAPSELDVLFVAEVTDAVRADDIFSGPQGELLLKAVVQGLGWKREQIDLLFLFSDPRASGGESLPSGISDAVRRRLDSSAARCIVMLGDRVASLVGVPDLGMSETFASRLVEHRGCRYLKTAALADVAQAEIKRRFWNDLKTLSAKLKN